MKILLIEDEPLLQIGLEYLLKEEIPHFSLDKASDEQSAQVFLKNKNYDLIFFDINLNGQEVGLQLLPLGVQKESYCVVLSSCDEEEYVRAAYEKGCQDYLTKPFSRDSLHLVLSQFKRNVASKNANNFFIKKFPTSDIEMQSHLEKIGQMHEITRPVFLHGPTGVGKTHLAKLIHEYNFDSKDKFIHLNCSEFPDNLLESELFGYEKGAFTGAEKRTKGKIELAHKGTLFLDEVATMSESLQKKLLRVIEEKTFMPLGSQERIHADFRIISATCENIFEQIKQKKFREDLYFRLEGINIMLKPLCERPKDITLLIKEGLQNLKRKVVISKEAMQILQIYPWPGNIREVFRFLEIVSLKKNGIIYPEDLPDKFLNPVREGSSFLQNIDWLQIKQKGLPLFLEEIEKEVVEKTWKENKQGVRATLKDLKISNNLFYRVMRSRVERV
ncbi:MAG: sigma-54-dependent Fis family transcriptional regulator [Bacteriovoracaceae bacterium]|nr:sigma-54-dependent Fis family transcriptional regulator [Bacteriovoracaceae bacterium]